MPTYDYKCENCGQTFEIFQSMKDEPLTLCEKCGHQTLKKMVSLPAGLIFKGTGFYQTDYKNAKNPAVVNSSNSKTKTENSIKDTQSKTTEAGKSESKSEAKSDSKSEKTSEKKSKKKLDSKSDKK